YLAPPRAARGADPAAYPDGLEHSEHAKPGDLASQLGLLPRHRHVRDRRQVVHLIGLHPLDGGDQAALIEQVASDQPDLRQELPELAHSRILLAADETPYLVALRGQVLGQIGTVLASDAGYQCSPARR